MLDRFRRQRGAPPSPDDNADGDGRRRAAILLAIGFVLLLFAYALILVLSRPPSPGTGLRYDEFLTDLRAGRIQNATALSLDRRIIGSWDAGQYWVDYGNDLNFTPTLNAIQAARVPVIIDNQWLKQLIGPLTVLMPALLIADALLFMILLTRGDAGGVLSFGRSSARRLGLGESKITFKDVAGLDEAVEELSEIKDYLANPARFMAMGAQVPRGILLIGPPGCGKTLLARAVAGEAGVPFFSISGSDFVEIFVGVGAARIRDLFKRAREAAPAIVFIDELDAVGRGRASAAVGGQDEREATLNQLLVGLDGFESESGVVVLAATNRPDVLDPALLRPGRFDRRVTIDRPDLNGRVGILKLHARGKPFSADVRLESLARRTAGMSGADLASVVNEAALLAARRSKPEIDNALLGEAVERVMAGPERRSRILEPKDKQLIAYHEAGHAVVSTVLHTGMVTKISLVSRANALGTTWLTPEDDSVIASRSQLQERLAFLMGGRAGEQLGCGEVSSTANDDLERASVLARRMVCELGMSDRLGPISMKLSAARLEMDSGIVVPWSDQVTAVADQEIRDLLERAMQQSAAVLTKHRDLMDRVAARLLEVESLEGAELDALLAPAPKLAVTT